MRRKFMKQDIMKKISNIFAFVIGRLDSSWIRV